MPFRPFPLGCSRFLSSVDSHDRCLQCLGIQRAEAAFVDGLCVRSERVTMAALRSHLSPLTGMEWAPSVTTRAGFSATSREPSASALGNLRVTVRAFPPGQSPRTFHSSRSSCSVRLVHAFMTSRLDYCNTLLGGCSWTTSGTFVSGSDSGPNRTQSWRPCFPGPPRDRAGGVHTSQSRALAARWLAPRHGLWLATTPCTLPWFLSS